MWPWMPLRHGASGSAIIAQLVERGYLRPESLTQAARSTIRSIFGTAPPINPAQNPRPLPSPSLHWPTSLHSTPFQTTSLPSFIRSYHISNSSRRLLSALNPPVSSTIPFPLGASFRTPLGLGRTFAAVPRRADGHVDIAAKARMRQSQKLWRLVGGGVVVAGFVAFVLNAFQENLVFYITPTQAVAALEETGVVPDTKRRLRLGGLVLDGSVRHFRNSTEIEFVVTDLATELIVRYRGAVPDLFREGHSVVVEGFLRPGEAKDPGEAIKGQLKAADPTIAKQTGLGMEGQTAGGERVSGCHFAATEVLAKHDEKYMPKEVAAVVAANKAAIDAENGLTSALARTEERPKKPSKQKIGQRPVQVQQYELKA